MLLSALIIVIADVLVKFDHCNRAVLCLTSPLMIIACILYVIECLLAAYLFMHGGDLAIYANLFIAFYSVFCTLFGIFLFGEALTLWQVVGILLILLGACFLA